MSRRGRMRWTGAVNERPTISDLALNPGKKARLFRILFQHGLCNGTALFLPYDQGLEHGPRDFFANPAAPGPAYIPSTRWTTPRGLPASWVPIS